MKDNLSTIKRFQILDQQIDEMIAEPVMPILSSAVKRLLSLSQWIEDKTKRID